MKKITANKTTVKTTDLTMNPFLAKYGKTKITDFEVGQYIKFSLPPGDVICTTNKDVLHNFEAVETAMRMGLKEMEVTMLDIDSDAAIQVISFKNMRRRLSRLQQAELIASLRKYMNETEAGKIWKEEVPGEEINRKIGFLVGYSYGMINQLERIYKYNPDLLSKIDDGDMTFTEALESLPKVRKPDIQVNTSELTTESKADTTPAPSHVESEVDGSDTTEEIAISTDTAGIECESCQTDVIAADGIKPAKVETDDWDFAGQKQTVPCESIQELVIRFASGKEMKLQADNGSISAEIFGKGTGNIKYGGGIQHNVDGSQFHVFKGPDNSQIQVIIYNSDNLAA